MSDNDRLAWAAVAAALILALMALAHGCGALGQTEERAGRSTTGHQEQGVAVPVSRVPYERPEPEMPELPEAVASYAPTETPATLATKKEVAALVAEIETIKAETQAAVLRLQEGAKQELMDAQKTRDVELAALEEKLRAETAALAERARAGLYDFNKWQWAIVAAAIAAVAYAYKRLSLTAALLALGGFAFLFALVLAGRHFPRLVALSPVPFILLLAYAAWRYGVVRRALVACARGIEIADNDGVKLLVRTEPGHEGVETVRKEIDQATVALARGRARERRNRAKNGPAQDKE